MPNYVSPTGRLVRVDSAEDAELYRSLGYHEEGVEESQARVSAEEESRYYSRGIERAKAAVEGFASGATVGLTDIIAGPESETAKRALVNPGTRLAGEIVGGFVGAPIKVTPAGAVATLGRTVTKKAGGGLLAKGAGGAVEGALYGTGAMAASARLSGDPINAEVLGAGIGLGGLIGFGAGAVGGALERSAMKRSGRAADEVVEDLVKKDKIASLESELAQLDNTLPPDRSIVPREHWDRLRHSARDIGDELRGVQEAAKDAIGQVKQAGSFAESVAKAEYRTIPGMGVAPDALVHGIAKQVDRQMTAFLSGRGNTDALRASAMDFFKEVDDLKAMGFNFTSGPASVGRDLVAGAIDAVEKSKISGDVAGVLRSLPKDPASMTRAQADKFAAAVQAAGGLSERVAGLSDSVDEFLKSVGTTRDGNLAERLVGGFDDLRTASREARTAARVKKENLPAMKQRRKELQEQLNELRKPAKDTKGPGHPVWTFMKRLAHYGGAMEGARVGRAVGGGYAAAMGAMVGGAGISTVMGFGPEGGGLAGVLLGARGRVRSRLNSAIMRWGGTAGRAVRRGIPAYSAILGATALSPAPRKTTDLRESVKDRIEEVAALMPTLPNNAYAATGWVADEHPELAVALQEHIVRAISYLHTMAPRNPGTVVVAGKDRWVPSEMKAREYAERWFGVWMPLEAGEEFLSGNASPAVIHALAATHPAYYDELRSAMLRKISDPKVMAKLDRHARSQVTWFTGVPMDSSERPEIVEFLQQQLTAPPVTGPVPPEQQASLGGRPPGPAQENLTQAQRLTAR